MFTIIYTKIIHRLFPCGQKLRMFLLRRPCDPNLNNTRFTRFRATVSAIVTFQDFYPYGSKSSKSFTEQIVPAW